MLADIHGPNLTIRGAPTTEEDERSLVKALDDVLHAAEGHGPSLAKEAARLCRLPRFHFFPQIYAATWDRCLMPRFRRLPFELLTQDHLPKLFGDVSAALRVLHSNNIVHADVHLDNIMLRPWPPGFVLIDLASCTAESVYLLELGFGVPGKGGALFTPPHEQLRPPMRTPAGDFYRFAKHIRKEIELPSAPKSLNRDGEFAPEPDGEDD
ncbi:GALNT6, partial [Symbiodinium pilosum]